MPSRTVRWSEEEELHSTKDNPHYPPNPFTLDDAAAAAASRAPFRSHRTPSRYTSCDPSSLDALSPQPLQYHRMEYGEGETVHVEAGFISRPPHRQAILPSTSPSFTSSQDLSSCGRVGGGRCGWGWASPFSSIPSPSTPQTTAPPVVSSLHSTFTTTASPSSTLNEKTSDSEEVCGEMKAKEERASAHTASLLSIEQPTLSFLPFSGPSSQTRRTDRVPLKEENEEKEEDTHRETQNAAEALPSSPLSRPSSFSDEDDSQSHGTVVSRPYTLVFAQTDMRGGTVRGGRMEEDDEDEEPAAQNGAATAQRTRNDAHVSYDDAEKAEALTVYDEALEELRRCSPAVARVERAVEDPSILLPFINAVHRRRDSCELPTNPQVKEQTMPSTVPRTAQERRVVNGCEDGDAAGCVGVPCRFPYTTASTMAETSSVEAAEARQQRNIRARAAVAAMIGAYVR